LFPPETVPFLKVTILQSGVYLNGSVNVVQNPTATNEVTSERTPPLSGRLTQQQVTMEGKTMGLCQPIAAQVQVDGAISSRYPQGVVTEADQKLAFDGKIWIESVQPWQMKGIRVAESKKKEEH
jgi:hypothetical protein